MDAYELGEAARVIYDFLWSDFCDWYIEMAKITLYGEDDRQRKQTVRSVLAFVLERTLCLLHPFMPFISEEIRLKLPQVSRTTVLAPWPEDPGFSV